MSIKIGDRFGRLTVVSPAEYTLNGRRWNCRCDCGSERVVLGHSLRRGATTSCGCYQRERSAQVCLERNRLRNPTVVTHGRSKTPEYRAWQKMKERCLKPSDKRYADYGGRGISVCPEWHSDFAAFYASVGTRPSPRHSLDRIDNDKGYEPGNCRWALPREQMTNRRMTRFVEVDGEEVPLADLAKRHGIPANTLRFRIVKGWDVDRAVTTPVRPKRSAA